MPNRYYSSALLGSDEKSVFIHIVITLSVVHTNLCAPFKHLPLSLAPESWIMMCEACFTWSVSSLVFLGHVWIGMCASFTEAVSLISYYVQSSLAPVSVFMSSQRLWQAWGVFLSSVPRPSEFSLYFSVFSMLFGFICSSRHWIFFCYYYSAAKSRADLRSCALQLLIFSS